VAWLASPWSPLLDNKFAIRTARRPNRPEPRTEAVLQADGSGQLTQIWPKLWRKVPQTP
jgi:hypothetical protein